jgi:D-alanyl-D-alanine carboxypeptidase (penicillin-binding protein 5/6)
MLPSGNDAALALADWGGACLVKGKGHKENVKEFVKEMNVRAVTLGLKDTRFGNVHGLPSKVTKSTAYDICQLCITCLSIPLFLKIISTKHYTTTTIPTPTVPTRTIHW